MAEKIEGGGQFKEKNSIQNFLVFRLKINNHKKYVNSNIGDAT